jgi:hypothetical protein
MSSLPEKDDCDKPRFWEERFADQKYYIVVIEKSFGRGSGDRRIFFLPVG